MRYSPDQVQSALNQSKVCPLVSQEILSALGKIQPLTLSFLKDHLDSNSMLQGKNLVTCEIINNTLKTTYTSNSAYSFTFEIYDYTLLRCLETGTHLSLDSLLGYLYSRRPKH